MKLEPGVAMGFINIKREVCLKLVTVCTLFFVYLFFGWNVQCVGIFAIDSCERIKIRIKLDVVIFIRVVERACVHVWRKRPIHVQGHPTQPTF